jgi:chemosensory pili system protein ChpC
MTDAFRVVPSILIPVQDHPLIVPCAAVAEVVRYVVPRKAPGAPEWLLGQVRWRDRAIPVVSFEAAQGGHETRAAAPANLVVLNVLRSDTTLGFYALASEGRPRLLQVSDRTIAGREDSAAGPLVACEVLVKGEPARIPDLAALENLVLAQATPAEGTHEVTS